MKDLIKLFNFAWRKEKYEELFKQNDNMKNKLNCILLIDDDDADNYIHQMIINDMNITDNIIVVENGLQALDYLKNSNKNYPELIFLDINMPATNGWEFLKKYNDLYADNKHKTLIIMLTTSENPQDKNKAFEISDSIEFINKPLTEKILRDIIAKHFN